MTDPFYPANMNAHVSALRRRRLKLILFAGGCYAAFMIVPPIWDLFSSVL
jgi:hypothetical protein